MLTQEIHERKRRLVQACEAANEHAEVRIVEREFDMFDDAIAEPWHDAATR
jgi:hypothetical protein